MATLLYHWNFTGANDLAVDDVINDSESNLKAVFKSRGTITSSTFSRGVDGITLNNTDEKSDDSGYYDGGYYIELEGLNTVGWGGNISIEMVIQNDELTVSEGGNKKSLYFSSTTEEGELTTNGATLVARFGGGKTKFLARPDSISNEDITYRNANPPYRNVNDTSNAVTEGTEHHYIFSLHYDSNGSSLKIFIDGNQVGENTASLDMELTNTIRGSNIIGTNKSDVNTTYLKGVVKYLKIYQNSMSDSQAESIYDSYNTSPYYSDISSGSNGDKYTRRHNNVTSYFNDNSSSTSFSIFGNQLGLSNGSETYTVHKFNSGDTINVSENFNYIPIQGVNKSIILKYNSNYFRIRQTSDDNDENAQYNCELSEGNTENFNEVCSKMGFGDTYSSNGLNLIFGGLEFNIQNEICFHEDTLINTDQGKVKIKNLKNYNTIDNLKIIYLVKSGKKEKELVFIKKDAFGENFPNKDLKLTKNHQLFINNKNMVASDLVDGENITIIENDSHVYNIILLGRNYIIQNNLIVNVFGIDQKYYDSLKELKDKEVELSFSSESKVKVLIDRLGNF